MNLKYDDIEPELRGLWEDFLAQYGIVVPRLSDGINTINHPCPLCGGEDRAHWRMQAGRLALYCRNCAADKMKSPETVIMEHQGFDFTKLIQDAADFINHVPLETKKKAVAKSKMPLRKLPPDHKIDPVNAEKMLSKCQSTEIEGMHFHTYQDHLYLAVVDCQNNVVNCGRLDNESGEVVFIAKSISYGGFTFVNNKPKDEILVVRDIAVAQRLMKIYGGSIAVAYSESNMKYLCLLGLCGELNMKPVIDILADDYLCYEMEHYKFDLDTDLIKCERDETYDK